MSTNQLKAAILKEINGADATTLKDIYAVIKTIKEQKASPAWDELTDLQKRKIETGLTQLREGKTVNARSFTESLKKKYGIKA
ncbi:MAG: hypothetical protein K2X48_10120 [Chitinophagaceae bacterium]|nr:hypothetical protein [Chitinophagaceae bacterium]